MPAEGGVELSPDPVLDDDTIKKMKVAELQVALQACWMPKNGLKAVLIDKLKTSVAEGVAILQYFSVAEIENSTGDVFHFGAYWKELEQAGPDMDDSIMNVEGVSFRAPTTTAKDYAALFMNLPNKHNYEETFYQAAFTAPTRLLPERNTNGKIKRDKNGNYAYKYQVMNETVINIEHLFANDIYFESQPADWFDLFFPVKRTKETHAKAVTMDNLTAWANIKAMMANAGSRGGKYSRLFEFNKPEIMSHLDLYLLHSIYPSPQVEMQLKSEQEDPVNGSSLCS